MESWPFQMRVEGCEHTDQSSDNEGDRDGEIRSAFRWCPHVIHIQTQTHHVQGDCVSETNDDVTGNRTRNDHLLDRSRPAQVAVAFKYWGKGQGGGGGAKRTKTQIHVRQEWKTPWQDRNGGTSPFRFSWAAWAAERVEVPWAAGCCRQGPLPWHFRRPICAPAAAHFRRGVPFWAVLWGAYFRIRSNRKRISSVDVVSIFLSPSF